MSSVIAPRAMLSGMAGALLIGIVAAATTLARSLWRSGRKPHALVAWVALVAGYLGLVALAG
jgi:hypothetical protein